MIGAWKQAKDSGYRDERLESQEPEIIDHE